MREENKDLSALPKGWVRTRLGEIAEINPKFLRDHLDDNMEVSFLPMKAVEERTGKVDLSHIKIVSQVKKGYTPFKNGDILFAKITPCMENGKIAVVNNLKNGIGFGSTEFHVLRLNNQIDKKLLFFFLLQDDYRKTAQRNMKGSAGQLRVPAYFIENTNFLLPSIYEQLRIVSKIEELFTRLDAGVEAVKKTKVQLKRYHQAVLKHAFEGKLTEEWRKTHKNELEPASVLLERIKEKREKNTNGKFNKFPPVDTSDLPKQPEGWVWVKLGAICDLINGRAFKPSEWSSKGLPIIRIQNLNNLEANFNYCDFEVVDKYLVNNNQLLFAWSGTPGTSFGAHIWRRDKAVLNQHIFKVEINESFINKAFFMHLLNDNVSEYIRKAHGTAGLAHITKNKFENSYVSLPPLSEQHKILEEIERRLSVADEVEKVVVQSLKQAERLRQSILKKAFEGKLVPQNPNDEPASVLLEQIRIQRQSHEKNNKPKRRKTRKGVICPMNHQQ